MHEYFNYFLALDLGPMIDCHRYVSFFMYFISLKRFESLRRRVMGVFSALLGFHRKVECSLGLWSTYIQGPERAVWGPKSQIRVTNGIFWTIGVLAK